MPTHVTTQAIRALPKQSGRARRPSNLLGQETESWSSVRSLFGSHLSIAGGDYKAVETAASLGLDAVQLLTKN